MDLVVVAAADPDPSEVALLGQVSDHALGRPLGDADEGGYVAQADGRVVVDAGEHVQVVGQERPRPARRSGDVVRYQFVGGPHRSGL
jgi:hypothetical protein